MQRIEVNVMTGETKVVELTAEEIAALPPPVNQRPAATEEFKTRRELLLSRLVQIAFVSKEAGDESFAAALLSLRKKIIPLDTHQFVLAALDTDLDALRAAYVRAYKAECAAALTTAPDQATGLAWKAEIDKVFK